MVLHTVFNQKVWFTITVMNYLNYAFNKIFVILSNAFLQTELFFSTVFISPTSAILWKSETTMLRFMSKSLWINIWLFIINPIAINCYWHLFLFFFLLVDILPLLSSYMRGSIWHDHILSFLYRLLFVFAPHCSSSIVPSSLLLLPIAMVVMWVW